MRILNVIPDGFPTFRPDVAALFGRYLPQLGVHTDLVTHSTGAARAPVDAWGGGRAVLFDRTGSRARDQLRSFVHDVRALRSAHRPAYDAIQVRDKVFAAVVAAWIGRRRGLPVFYWMSFPMSEAFVRVAREGRGSIGWARRLFLLTKGVLGRTLLYAYVLPRCSHVFVQSDRMLEEVAARGVAPGRMTPVVMGVDLARPTPTRADGMPDPRLDGRRVVAYLGSLERFRRLDLLLEAMQHVAASVPDAVLLMIGDSPEPDDRRRLERLAESLGIAERVLWTGWVSAADAWRWLVTADVAVSIYPSGPLYDSASPTKVVEYLALGIPVVANDQPDQKKVLEESGAGICVAMDRAAFAAAIERILLHPDVAAPMRAAGRPYLVARRDYRQLAAEVAAVYRRVLHGAVPQ